ncbi:RNA polymerase sigma-70 factor (ECF subfamily) [Roseimicrobium gellanilyticum]|uniref:RNA polymerase sigma-70 factor (ECF subfamily) n=1 Tax=Roseimicrobium gellanilyticum TaxID=748857 RepID=A0A366HSR4_9BACT|nr:sigma-70 family RNA polymerase sigma factor [Roseimicrobium gellanilyticum]RBP47316.1 RNA polymerase sigma-70 factor (ECF subfamily) [Roseimicrobium gellanilyticum]
MPNPTAKHDVPRLTEHLFRHEAGRLVAMLTGIFGINRLQLAEDVVQEAMARALQVWPYYGVPQNPTAWLMQTARNLALDVVRREKSFGDKEEKIVLHMEQSTSTPDDAEGPMFEDEIKVHRLRLMFACCHPDIPQESQIALALKTLCGFTPIEIAKAFLTTEAATAKRLTRARQRIQEMGIPFEIPSGPDLPPRLDGVLHILYLLFNEGYKASSGDNLVREELCHEAIQLATQLAEHSVADQPRTHALIALMLLNAARFSTRVDGDGNMLRLRDQNRAEWNREHIARGMLHLSKASMGEALSEYHLQAGIAACHTMAPSYDATDWRSILSLYDRWMELTPSPVVALNRAVAVAQVEGAKAGIAAVESMRHRDHLESYHLVYAVLGDFESQLGNKRAAAIHFRKALRLTDVTSEQSFLEGRLRECGDTGGSAHAPRSRG